MVSRQFHFLKGVRLCYLIAVLSCQSPSDGFNLKRANVADNLAKPEIMDVSSDHIRVQCGILPEVSTVITERGVFLRTTSQNLSERKKISSGAGTGSFVLNLTELLGSTGYVIETYAVADRKLFIGPSTTAETQASQIPAVSETQTVSGISQRGAFGGGTILRSNGSPVLVRGVVWSTEPSPNLGNRLGQTEDGNGVGRFSSALSDLLPGTRYFVRAYASNAVGTAYGPEVQFNTPVAAVPELGPTQEVTNISQSGATSGGTVYSDMGSAVTARGVVWGTSPNPTISNRIGQTNNGAGSGSFTSTLTDLVSGTTYYVRAYASNEVGTAYGSQISFSTRPAVLPTLGPTKAPSNITFSSASSGGVVVSSGGAVITAFGMVWGTSSNPTISNRVGQTNDGSGAGDFISTITGLLPLTTYFARSYAINSAGTGYGSEISFKTNSPPLEFGLIAKYLFNQGSVLDNSGYEKHGFNFGTTPTSDRFNSGLNALSFNGSSSYVHLPADLKFGPEFSIAGWVYVKEAKYWERFFDFGSGPYFDNTFLSFSYANDGVVVAENFNEGVSSGYLFTASKMELNQWKHIAYTVSRDTMRIFVDAQKISERRTSVQLRNVNRSQNYLGKSNWGVDRLFFGFMDDIYIYNRTLNQSDVYALYVLGNQGNSSSQ